MKISAFSKSYDGVPVLDFPGMELERGRIYAVIGANGSGKSTFAKLLAGVIKADSPGRVHDAASLGYMPQKNYAFRMSTGKNLLLNGGDTARAKKLMSEMRITHLENKPAHRLSGGETARMALVRLMMRDYELVVLDEPTAALDMESSLLAEKLIGEYVQQSGCAMMLITHSLRQAERLADEVLYFHKGKLEEAGEAEKLLHDPQSEQTRSFLDFYGS